MSGPFRAFATLLAVSLVFGFVARAQKETVRSVTEQEVVRVDPSGVPVPTEIPTVGGTTQLPPPKKGLECASGRNGGATDKGVTANEIKLATTMVQSGPAASLLRDAPAGMRAVISQVNATGGVCGRRLTLTAVDDGFDAQRGQTYIRNFIDENYFALPVVPSSEGLSAAIKVGEISKAKIPVVGTDGLRREQYRDPYVWPVGAATRSIMRIMAGYGYAKRGARTFGIVWDSKYKFGVEGAEAFKAEVKRLGGRVVADRPLDPDQSSYASEVNSFNGICKSEPGCDMVAMLLLPDTAQKWLGRDPAMGRVYSAGAQTLFTNQFAENCVGAIKAGCHGLAVWTGYLPPIGSFAGRRDVAEYVDDVTTARPGIDVNNQFVEGAYLGMRVFVEALRRVGPDLTRARLRAALDSMTFTSDLSSPLTWRPGKHCANLQARAFSVVVSQGTFNGWRDEGTGWLRDPKGCA